MNFLFGPVVILHGIYAKYFGLSLATIAAVIMISRLLDAVSDPVIGYLSDIYYHKNGTRKPFVLVGGLLFLVSCFFLYIPPENVKPTYFLIWLILMYLSWTLFEIPHLAWGCEISKLRVDISKIYNYRTFGIFSGMLLYFSVPLLPVFDSNEFTPDTLKWSVITASIIMLPLLFLCLKFVPDGEGSLQNKILFKKSISPLKLGSIIINNRPFMMFLLAFLFAGIGVGMWLALLYFFVDAYMGHGDNLSILYIASFLLAMLSLFAWQVAALKFERKTSWCISMVLIVGGIIGTGCISPNGTPLFILLAMVFVYSGIAGLNIFSPSILADIVDYSSWKFGTVDNTATYYSIYTLVSKANIAIGGALGLFIPSLFGYDPAQSNQTDFADIGLRLAVSWLPACLIFISVLVIVSTSLSTRRHSIIQKRLRRHAPRLVV